VDCDCSVRIDKVMGGKCRLGHCFDPCRACHAICLFRQTMGTPNDTIGTSQPTVWYNSTGNISPPSRSPLLDDLYKHSTTLALSAWMDTVHAPIDNTVMTNQEIDTVSAALALCLLILGGYAYRWTLCADHHHRVATPPRSQRLVCCVHDSQQQRCNGDADVHPTRPERA
jgi:hypothetical protein